MVVCHAIWNSSQRGNPLSTQEVLPAWKGELIGSFFLHAQKKWKRWRWLLLMKELEACVVRSTLLEEESSFHSTTFVFWITSHTHISSHQLFSSASSILFMPLYRTKTRNLTFFSFQSLALSHLSMLLVLNPRSLYQKQPKRIRGINVDGKVQLWQR